MKKLFAGVAAAALVLGGLLGSAVADDKQAAAVGEAAPAFTLKGVDGKEYTLEALKGKIVVLEWFNPDCPYVVKQYQKTTVMKDTYTHCKEKGAVWLAVATGKTANNAERLQKAIDAWKIEYPVLLDSTGTVGHAYGARTTPHMYVIDAEGKLAYAGAIDNNKSADTKGDKNFVIEAVDALAAGQEVETKTWQPYGCSVKYASNK